jgi:hypothetical protein
MPFAKHPDVPYTFIHVIPDDWGPYFDLRACWRQLARRRPYVHVLSVREFHDCWAELKSDPQLFFIVWDLSTVYGVAHNGRRCKLAHVYSEALDDDHDKMLPAHVRVWALFKEIAPRLDCVFAHTPWMVSSLNLFGMRATPFAYVMPAGWDEAVMGTPRWEARKLKMLSWHGSMVGRREVINPYVSLSAHQRWGDTGYEDISGCYGRSLLGRLDNSNASLYIAHSEVRSFSTWRLWQVASTSAILIAEPGDSWPFEPGKHYFGITQFSLTNLREVWEEIVNAVSAPDRVAVFNEAHELARKFTVDIVLDSYIVPAAAKLDA